MNKKRLAGVLASLDGYTLPALHMPTIMRGYEPEKLALPETAIIKPRQIGKTANDQG